MKRTITLILLMILFITVAVACENKEETGMTEDTTDNSGEDVSGKDQRKVIFATVAGYYTTALEEIAEEYNEINPETTVQINPIQDNTAYKTNFDAKMAAGGEDAPDIVHVNLVGDTTEYVNKGYLLPLNDFIEETNPYNEDKKVIDGINSDYKQYMYNTNGDVVNLTFDLVGTGFYYNKDIFDELGLSVPNTWEELFEVSQEIEDAGYIPLAMPFQYQPWMQDTFLDWNARSMYPEMLILPGDARYDENLHSRNLEIKESDPSDPNFDVGAVFDPEKTILTWKNKEYDNQGQVEKVFFPLLKRLSQYYEPGFATLEDQEVYALFISQNAAMYWNGSWQIGPMITDMKKLGDNGFEWGTFKFPEFAEPNELFPGDPRGILVPGHMLGISNKKDEEQMERAKDFLKYLFSPEVAQKVYERTLELGEFVQGPSLVNGVELPKEINAYMEGFKVAGNMHRVLGRYSGNTEVIIPELKQPLISVMLDYYNDKLSLEDFLEKKAELVEQSVEKYIEDNEFDLDPKTNP